MSPNGYVVRSEHKTLVSCQKAQKLVIKNEFHRGEAYLIKGHWYQVYSECRKGKP